MKDIEADDRRVHKYSNIQHPFFLKPEFFLMGIAGLLSTAIIATLWFTSAIGDVNSKADKNTGDIEHVKEIQRKAHDNFDEDIAEIKESQKELKTDMNKGFDKIGGKIDKLIDRQLDNNGNN